jgi:hypothetical protein
MPMPLGACGRRCRCNIRGGGRHGDCELVGGGEPERGRRSVTVTGVRSPAGPDGPWRAMLRVDSSILPIPCSRSYSTPFVMCNRELLLYDYCFKLRSHRKQARAQSRTTVARREQIVHVVRCTILLRSESACRIPQCPCSPLRFPACLCTPLEPCPCSPPALRPPVVRPTQQRCNASPKHSVPGTRVSLQTMRFYAADAETRDGEADPMHKQDQIDRTRPLSF